MAREIQEINAGSMADIAFLLLIFFLITTTMDVDSGITRKLPPYEKDITKTPPIKERNVLVVLVNSRDELMVENELMDISRLRETAKEFIANPKDLPNLPEKKVENVKYIGEYPISKQVISLRNDRGTTYGMYIKVQNELTAAYNELRDELSKQYFGVKFDKLDEDHQNAILQIYPNHISEAEPKNVGGQ